MAKFRCSFLVVTRGYHWEREEPPKTQSPHPPIPRYSPLSGRERVHLLVMVLKGAEAASR
ncbi:hypothetical protein E2C01_076900 [Portunus trituberculatus]|uniref:Uncharacterized protein n=1 Tax=Portunus trituberculatus TaxID=210409 RepID=A0A5B7IKV1_PORTR|nr:hypothetical protein [Portunus trituberculatus]